MRALRKGTVRALLPLVALLTGCNGAQPVQSQVLLNHGACNGLSPGVQRVALHELQRIRGSRLLRLNDEGSAAASLPELTDATELLAVSRGDMPTAGYRFELNSVTQKGSVLTLDLKWQEPAPDSVQLQVITHPCLVVAVPVTGVESIVAQSNGEPLGELRLPPR